MPPNRSAESRMGEMTRYIWDRITWDWQLSEPLIQQAAETVPPGKALRHYETSSKSYRRTKGADRTKPELSRSEKIRSGARGVAVKAYGTLTREGQDWAIQMKGPDDQWYVRRKPHCETCRCGHAEPVELQGPGEEEDPKASPRSSDSDNVLLLHRESRLRWA